MPCGAPYSAPLSCRPTQPASAPQSENVGPCFEVFAKPPKTGSAASSWPPSWRCLTGSFAIWGINDIFRGFGRSTLAKIGSTEISIDQFRQAYNDRLQQIEPPARPADPAGPGARSRARPAGAGRDGGRAGLDQRARQMRLGHCRRRYRQADHQRSEPQGLNGKFDRARFELVLRNTGFNEQRFVNEQRQTALRRQIVDSVSGDVARAEGLARRRSTSFRTNRAASSMWRLARHRPATLRNRPPSSSTQIFRRPQVPVPRAGIPQDRDRHGDAGRTREAGRRFPTTTSNTPTTSSAPVLPRRRSAASSRSCSRPWPDAQAAAPSSIKGGTTLRRISPPSAVSRTRTSTSAR